MGWHRGIGTALALAMFNWLEKLISCMCRGVVSFLFCWFCFLNKRASPTVLIFFSPQTCTERHLLLIYATAHVFACTQIAIGKTYYRKMLLGLLSNFSILLIWNTLSTVLSVWLVHRYIDVAVSVSSVI